MMTPEPRSDDSSSRDPNQSSCSPKNCRKNGSLPNGEFGLCTTVTAEMLTMPATARLAMALKSGSEAAGPPGWRAPPGAAAVALPPARWAGVAAPSAADRSRPVRTSPAMNPTRTRRMA